MNSEQKARRYFAQPGFSRMLAAIWKRYARLEKAGGHAVVPHASSEECEAINAFFGWFNKPGDTIRVPLARFEQELMESAFPYTIAELHELLTSEPLQTESDRKLMALEDWQKLFKTVAEQCHLGEDEPASAIVTWLGRLRDGQAAGYRTVRELWNNSPEQAQQALIHAVRAWYLLSADSTMQIRLPVLAARATGDPHALDRNAAAGRLLLQALDQTIRTSSAMDTLEARSIYRQARIIDDDISSLVHVYDRGESEIPYVLTLRQIEQMKALPMATDLYVVENPAVFSTLVDLVDHAHTQGQVTAQEQRDRTPLLLCTSGPASAAALRLIDRYIQDLTFTGKLYYSGDFDIKGIEMGNVLASRYEDRLVAWRFDHHNYAEGCARAYPNNVAFSADERLRLTNMQALWDPSLCVAMGQTGYKLFQEQLIDRFSADWAVAVKSAIPTA
jgi:uncharacterized protein (TIGR02679 family)